MRFVHADKPDFPVQYDLEDRIATHNRFEKQNAYIETLFEPIISETLAMDQRWIVPGFIPRGTLAILAGDPKSGKTCLASALAMAVATGTPFAGMPTHQTGVLWLACEESRRERLEILKHSPLFDPATPLYTCYQYFPVDTEEGLYYLQHWVREVDCSGPRKLDRNSTRWRGGHHSSFLSRIHSSKTSDGVSQPSEEWILMPL